MLKRLIKTPLLHAFNRFRLLDTDTHAVFPIKTHVRGLISSADVDFRVKL
jgi:hypothetical protein